MLNRSLSVVLLLVAFATLSFAEGSKVHPPRLTPQKQRHHERINCAQPR